MINRNVLVIKINSVYDLPFPKRKGKFFAVLVSLSSKPIISFSEINLKLYFKFKIHHRKLCIVLSIAVELSL